MKEGRALHPSSLGRVLTSFLIHYFPTYLDPDFTSTLEEQLDLIAGEGYYMLCMACMQWFPSNIVNTS